MLRTGKNILLPHISLASWDWTVTTAGSYSVAASLTDLTKNKAKFKLMISCEKSFHELKDKLTSALLLTLPNCCENYTVYGDSSRVCLGCVLMKIYKVITYAPENSRFMKIIIPLMTYSF